LTNSHDKSTNRDVSEAESVFFPDAGFLFCGVRIRFNSYSMKACFYRLNGLEFL